MKIGRSKQILINPNATKFACILMIVTGWFMWPKEEDYVNYEKKRSETHV